MNQSRPGRPMPKCAAQKCRNLPTKRAGYCAQHTRSLQLTAAVADAVREFLRSAGTPADSEIDDRADSSIESSVIEAGEHLAIGLGLLVGTQFAESVRWNPVPIHVDRYRWRTEFIWQIDGFEEMDESARCGRNSEVPNLAEADEDDYHDEDESVDEDDSGETDDLKDEPIGAMAR